MSARGFRQVLVGTAPKVTSSMSLKLSVTFTNEQTRNRRLYIQ